MDDSGDLEILERQASLLQTLLGNLERRRTHRRRTAEPSPPTPPVEPRLDPSDDPSPARAPLRLVEQPQARPLEPGRKPHFREKRRWNLSGPATRERSDLDEQGDAPVEEEAGEPHPDDNAAVPWQAFQQLLRERDDLLLQLSHHQSAQGRLMEERAAGERKDQEIQQLQEELRGVERSGMRDLIDHLRGRLQLAEQLERQMMERVLGAGPAEGLPQPVAPSTGRNAALRVRGCQVELATAVDPGGVVYSFAVLTRRSPDGVVRKGFHALGGSEREAELACLDGALRYLEGAVAAPSATLDVLRIQGRQVEILCDTESDGTWRAFPFVHEDGGRRILLRFHVQEALTGPSAAEARRRCIDRLQDHFL